MNSTPSLCKHRRIRRCVGTVLVASLTICLALPRSVAQAADETPTAAAVIEAYRAYLDRVDNIGLTSTLKGRNAEQSDVPTNGLEQSWKVDFRGRRLWRTTRSVFSATPLPEGIRETYSEQSWTPHTFLEAQVDVETGVAESIGGLVSVPEDYWTAAYGIATLGYPFGYLPDGLTCQFIPDLLRDATVTIDDSGAVTLESVNDEYRLSVRLDPEKGWMVDRIEYTLIDKDPARVRRENCLYEVTASSVHDDVWIPDAYRCREVIPAREYRPKHLRLVDGAVVSVREGVEVGEPYVVKHPRTTGVADVTLTDISLQPLCDADFTIQAKVPEVLPVSMQDDRDSEFVWMDGKVVRLSTGPLSKRR